MRGSRALHHEEYFSSAAFLWGMLLPSFCLFRRLFQQLARRFGLAFLLQQGGMLAQNGASLLLCRCFTRVKRRFAEVCFCRSIIAVGPIHFAQLGVNHGPMPVCRAPLY